MINKNLSKNSGHKLSVTLTLELEWLLLSLGKLLDRRKGMETFF